MANTTNILIENILEKYIFSILPSRLVTMIRAVPVAKLANLTEIRLRINRPLLLVLGNTDMVVSPIGRVATNYEESYLCNLDDVHKTLQLISKNSLYAFEQELKMGFLTIDGGHRVGLAGQAIIDGGDIKSLKNISSLNIRLAREVIGCADKIMPYIRTLGGHVLNTLIISPPRCGKTTILRDMIRQISTGSERYKGLQVGVVDERSEIAACKNGISTVDLGMRTDVLDSYPKAIGMLMLIRSMSPAVVATDELGRAEDIYAVQEALNAGVSVVTTVHGNEIGQLLHRPYVRELLEHKYFQRYIILSDHPCVGTIERIIDSKNNEILWDRASE